MTHTLMMERVFLREAMSSGTQNLPFLHIYNEVSELASRIGMVVLGKDNEGTLTV